jgi:glyoxylase-like metal-dependent hydrolase (beta-lactamase superfamily II)
VYDDSVAPIFEAGLGDIVPTDADLGDGMRLVPSPGHTPGHVSLWLESDGEALFVTGDILHHPVQCAELDWHEIGDQDTALATETRRRLLGDAARSGALVIGTHFPSRPAGRVVANGDAFRFVPEGGAR